MAEEFKGKQVGYPDPTVTRGEGIVAGSGYEFFGVQPGQADPTVEGTLKKRLPLGEGTVLDVQNVPAAG